MKRVAAPGIAVRVLRASVPREWRDSVEREVGELQALRAGGGGPGSRLWYWRQAASFAARFAAERLRSRFRRGGGGADVGARAGRPGPVRDLALDVRHAWRTLLKTPLMTGVSVVSLGLGIGVSTTIYAVGRSFLREDPGPVADTGRLVTIYTSGDRGRRYDETSFQDYLDVVGAGDVLQDVAALRMGVLTETGTADRDRWVVEIVTGNYFDVLGVRPPVGRTFDVSETRTGSAEPLLVLSQRAWRERFGSDPGVVGRTVELDGRVYTVVGVGPAGLVSRYLQIDIDGWLPVGIAGGTWHSTAAELADRGDRDYSVFARLRPGVTLEAAATRLSVLAERLRAKHPGAWIDERGNGREFTVLTDADSRIPPDARAALTGTGLISLGLAFLILLVACANVSSLLLARARQRLREFAIRASLGASRGRLVRMLLTESTLLAFAGGVAGLFLARIATRYIGRMPLPIPVPLRFRIELDPGVVLFALAVSALAALFAGLGPALRASRSNLVPSLRDLDDGRRRLGFQRVLVVAQVAAATALLVGTGLALRSLDVGSGYTSGLDVDRVAVAWKELPAGSERPEDARRSFLDLADRLAADPAVESVALARVAEGYAMMENTATALVEEGGVEPAWVGFNSVTPGYMEMLGLRIERGRPIGSQDVAGAPPVAVVNRAFADRYWPGGQALGRRIRVTQWRDFGTPTAEGERTLDVVGVSADAPAPGEAARPFIWTSFLQDLPVRAILHVRGRSTADAVVPLLLRELEADRDGNTLIRPGPYRELAELRFVGNRVASKLFAGAGVFALVLAVMGIHGIVSWAVSRRLREMAIRLALGAREKQTVLALVREGLAPASLGIVAGLAAGGAGALLVRSALFGISPLDPLAIGGVGAVLLLAAFAASLVPALRLTTLHPMNVLRDA